MLKETHIVKIASIFFQMKNSDYNIIEKGQNILNISGGTINKMIFQLLARKCNFLSNITEYSLIKCQKIERLTYLSCTCNHLFLLLYVHILTDTTIYKNCFLKNLKIMQMP